MLEKAALAIYAEEKIADIPHAIKVKYFLRSKDRSRKEVRIIQDLRNKTKYYRQNLLYLPAVSKPEFDIVFCRNVLIYFDRSNQYAILSRITSYNVCYTKLLRIGKNIVSNNNF